MHDPASVSSKDNSIFRLDFKKAGPRATAINKSFARIKRIFQHTMFPGGPTQLFVEGAWYRDEGVCPIAGTQLVSPHPTHEYTLTSKFVALTQSYQQPVALWPYDPHALLPAGDKRTTFLDVIDRNEEQEA